MSKRTMKFKDFVGNETALEKLDLLIHEARNNDTARIPDFAFLGASGLGKSTLSRIVANELGRHCLEINSTAIRDPYVFRQKVIDAYTTHHNGVIVLLDECHSLPRKIQDNLLTSTEHPRVLQTAGKDIIHTDSLPDNCSFIFSTTHSGLIQKALLTRLEVIELFPYSLSEQFKMAVNYLTNEVGLSEQELNKDSLKEVAKRARNGRQVVKFCDSLVRYKSKHNLSSINKDMTIKCFKILGVDSNGLTEVDRMFLKKLSKSTGSMGLDTLEAILPCTKKEIKERIEPFLLRRNMIIRTKAGRVLTDKGRLALNG